MNVTIQPWPGETGRKSILVDGEQWGSIHMERNGPRGVSYWFKQAGAGHQVTRTTKSTNTGRTYESPVKVRGDKLAARSAPAGVTVAPLDARLIATVHDLITEGLLKSETSYRAEVAARQAKFSETQERAKHEKEQATRDEATRRLADVLGAPVSREVLDTVLDLMTWAQTR